MLTKEIPNYLHNKNTKNCQVILYFLIWTHWFIYLLNHCFLYHEKNIFSLEHICLFNKSIIVFIMKRIFFSWTPLCIYLLNNCFLYHEKNIFSFEHPYLYIYLPNNCFLYHEKNLFSFELPYLSIYSIIVFFPILNWSHIHGKPNGP